MITINDLEFNKSEATGNTPEVICHCCGNQVNIKDAYIADYKISEDADCTFVVCSEECLKEFKKHPHVNEFINDSIEQSKLLHDL